MHRKYLSFNNKIISIINKKLKIYSTLFVVVLIVFGVTSIFHYDSYTWVEQENDKFELVENPEGFVTHVTCDTLENGVVKKNYSTPCHSTVSYDVFVQPKLKQGRKELISTSLGQTYKIDMQKVRLTAPTSQTSWKLFPIIFVVTSIIVITIVVIWILYMVYRLIRNIRRGNIFVAQVAKYLETTGILLSALYLYDLAASYIIYLFCSKNIYLADYYIVFKNESNIMYIITGLALMIISQIILMGKELKEEQELTV